MRNTSMERVIATSVLVAFEDGSVSFRIPPGATLADISENLDKIGNEHKGQLLSVDVRFKTPKDRCNEPTAAYPLGWGASNLAAQPEYASWLHRIW
jgi:hypothetical protein